MPSESTCEELLCPAQVFVGINSYYLTTATLVNPNTSFALEGTKKGSFLVKSTVLSTPGTKVSGSIRLPPAPALVPS